MTTFEIFIIDTSRSRDAGTDVPTGEERETEYNIVDPEA